MLICYEVHYVRLLFNILYIEDLMLDLKRFPSAQSVQEPKQCTVCVIGIYLGPCLFILYLGSRDLVPKCVWTTQKYFIFPYLVDFIREQLGGFQISLSIGQLVHYLELLVVYLYNGFDTGSQMTPRCTLYSVQEPKQCTTFQILPVHPSSIFLF